MKSFSIHKKYICNFTATECPVLPTPICKDCSLYKTWKKSGLTIDKYYRYLRGMYE